MTIRAHKDKDAIDAKMAMLGLPHIMPLTELARRIRKKHPHTPFFDPKNGGVDAHILFLLEAPGPQAINFVSQENNDPTAENLYHLINKAGLSRNDIVLWNIVPFYIGAENLTKIQAANKTHLEAGKPWLIKLLGLLPKLKVVVLLGRKAQRACKLIQTLRPDLCVLKGWHPSCRAIGKNQSNKRWQELLTKFQDAKRYGRS